MLRRILIQLQVATFAVVLHHDFQIASDTYGTVVKLVIMPVALMLSYLISECIDQYSICMEHTTQF